MSKILSHLSLVYRRIKNSVLNTAGGFSLAELMIGLGLFGMTTLVVTKYSEQGFYLKKRSEQVTDANLYVLQMTRSLLEREACLQSFNSLGDITTSPTLTSLRDAAGTAVYTVGDSFAGGAVRLEALDLTNVTVTSTPLNAGDFTTVDADLVISASRPISSDASSSRAINKFTIPLKFEVNSSYQVTGCNSSKGNFASTSLANSCKSINGVFNGATGTCDLAAYPAPSDTSTGVSAEYLYNTKISVYDPKYAKDSGDQVFTGALTSTGTITANQLSATGAGKLCTGSGCRSFTTRTCAGNTYITKVNSDGTVVCSASIDKHVHDTSSICGPYKVLRGYNPANGFPICRDIRCTFNVRRSCPSIAPADYVVYAYYGSNTSALNNAGCIVNVVSYSCEPYN